MQYPFACGSVLRRHAACQLRFSLLLIILATGVGCSRINGFRHRWFARDRTVPAVELGMAPAASNRPGIAKRKQPEPPPTLLSSLPRSTWGAIGRSVDDRPIEGMVVGSGSSRIMLIGGIHGDEPEGLPLVERLVDDLGQNRSLSRDATILIVRNINPDGTADRTRTNKNGVDLNRNFPAANWDSSARQPRFHPGTGPASEPETQVLVQLIQEFEPHRILVMHSTRGKPMVNYDGPARELAESMSRLNGYVSSDTIGYPTPGSLGSYAGIDMKIPIITLELPRGIGSDSAWQANREALYRFVQ
jgi:predicted deacylase